VAIDHDKKATEGALEAADEAGGKIAAAAVSAATAYGGVPAFVSRLTPS
jgi:hypothetical protein